MAILHNVFFPVETSSSLSETRFSSQSSIIYLIEKDEKEKLTQIASYMYWLHFEI